MTSGRTMIINVVWILVLVVELFFYTWCRVECLQTGYALTESEARGESLRQQQAQLRIELAHLKSPKEITRRAEKKLGLVMPSLKQMVTIDE